MKKKILLLLSVFAVSLLLFSCAPQPGAEGTTNEAGETQETLGAEAKVVSDIEVEADLKKLSLEDLDDLIEVGELDKDKPLVQQAYENPDWLKIAYKVKAEKLAEVSGSAAVNHAPVLTVPTDKEVEEGGFITFSVSATDEDGDALTYDLKGEPMGVSFEDEEFSWKPGFDQAGKYELVFTVSDGELIDVETVVVTVINVNQPPQFVELGQIIGYVNQNSEYQLKATDPDGDTVTFGYGADAPNWMELDAESGNFGTTPPTVAPFGFTFTVLATDGTETVEQAINLLVFPKSCSDNTDCPVGNFCKNVTQSCAAWDMDDLRYTCKYASANMQAECEQAGIAYYEDKKHYICYKVSPEMTVNSCTVTKVTEFGPYKYDCSFKAECDYSMQT